VQDIPVGLSTRPVTQNALPPKVCPPAIFPLAPVPFSGTQSPLALPTAFWSPSL
jgi:hypothetical protein